MDKNDFGYRVKKAMQDSDLTQKQLAQKLKLTKAEVSNWVLGKNHPTFKKLKELMKLTGKDANYYFGYPSCGASNNSNIFGNNNNNINQIIHNSEDIQFLKKEVMALKSIFKQQNKCE